MKRFKVLFFALFIIFTMLSCTEKKTKIIDTENLYAWCIVPYDSVQRSPLERIEMLKKLGITKYAYDWREKHLSTMAEELKLAKRNDIETIAVWLWIDDQWDAVGALNPLNTKMLDIIKEVGYKGQIWVSFNSNYFANMSDSLAVNKSAEMLSYLSDRTKETGCKIALYNHGDWFGEPRNQVKIIETLSDYDLGIVYNFHHAHNQIDAFSELVKTMMPYLWYVNINGLRKEGPKILTVGEGDYEMNMIKVLKENGYKGDFGILGHVEEADVETILKANLNGLYQK